MSINFIVMCINNNMEYDLKMTKNIHILSSRNCTYKWYKKHVSYNTILGMEDEFIEYMNNGQNLICFSRKVYIINKFLRKLKIDKLTLPDKKVIKKVNADNDKLFFASMSIVDLLDFKHTLKIVNRKLIIYVFDCWESQFDEYKKIFDEINPMAICFAYKKAMQYFSLSRENCWFIPQSADVRYFHPYDVNKKRLFIQMGRRVEKLHNLAMNYITKNKAENIEDNYIYEKEKGMLIFPETNKLSEEIAKTFFFLAAPQSVTNRELTGNISEVTARFYEAMMCKTIIIGIKPRDTFDQLFPYEEAMMEVDEENFEKTVNDLLNDKDRYKKITDYNYEYVMKYHRWKNRLYEIQKRL